MDRMIKDDKKLLCAFIIAADDSGHCMPAANTAAMQKQKIACLDYLEGRSEFPEAQVGKVLAKIKRSGCADIRDYIYNGHVSMVKKDAEDLGVGEFFELMKVPYIRSFAISCPVRFYEIEKVYDDRVEAKDIFSNQVVLLKKFQGLEDRLETGDLISGHWSYVLESFGKESSGRQKFDEYKKQYGIHYSEINRVKLVDFKK